MKYAVALAAAASALGLSAPAAAAPYIFTLTGDYQASWQLDSNPTPNNSYGYKFVLKNITGDFPGLAGSFVVLDFYTWDAELAKQEWGGFTLSDQTSGAVLQDGYDKFHDVQLFTGPASAPVFKTGTFSFLSNVNGNPLQLVIAEATAPVPEPATWAMMIAGFGLVGGAMRRTTNVRTRVAYAHAA